MEENIVANRGPAVVSLNKWLTESGVTPITAWRWRRRGWLETTNISGRLYLTAEAIAKFTRRAQAGEFAAKHPTPQKAIAA